MKCKSHLCMMIASHFLLSRSYTIVESCWNASPDKRPTFTQLVDKITALLTSVADYFVLSPIAEQPEDS